MDHFARVNGIQLHYLDHPGGAPALVLMPGLTANAHNFDGLIEAGLSPELRVIAVDLRGRGLSDKPDSGYSMADHAADVLGLLDVLGLDEVILAGHSFGGLLALYMAAHHPARIGKLVLIDAAAAMHPKTGEMIRPSIDRLGKVWPSWGLFVEMMKEMPFHHGWWDPQIESHLRADVEIRADGTVVSRVRPEAILEAVGKVKAEDWDQHAAKVSQPMLLLNALGPCGLPGAPPLLPLDRAMKTVHAVANCRYVEVPGNHMTMLYGEGARRTVEAILAFVRG